jgi:hypothetical protein
MKTRKINFVTTCPLKAGDKRIKNMETVVKMKKVSAKQQLDDILLDITWSKISSRYFGKSPSWIYHKIDGIDGNGQPNGFSEEEKENFRGALFDLSDRIRKVAQGFA